MDDKISPYQAGFRRDRNTYDDLFCLQELCERSHAVNKPLYIAFLNILKAFDKAWRNGILFKLLSYRIILLLSKLLLVFLRRLFRLLKFSVLTREFATTSGVRSSGFGFITVPF